MFEGATFFLKHPVYQHENYVTVASLFC